VEGVRAQFLQPRNVEISSSELRQRLAHGLQIDHIVPFEIVETLNHKEIT
jgi:nicotinic acid mononucleotide adenylyltransferase